MTTTATTIDVNGSLARLREIRDEKEGLEARLKELSSSASAIERDLLAWHESTGLESVKGGGMSVSFKESLRASYDPEKWESIVAWAVNTGNLHLIQRRLTDSRVVELIEAGTALPDGLRTESYVKLNIRRV